jgi:hypothetical protein
MAMTQTKDEIKAITALTQIIIVMLKKEFEKQEIRESLSRRPYPPTSLEGQYVTFGMKKAEEVLASQKDKNPRNSSDTPAFGKKGGI